MNKPRLLVLDIFLCFMDKLEFVFAIFEFVFSDVKNFLNNLEKKQLVMIIIEKVKLTMCMIFIYFHKIGFFEQISKGFNPYGIINSSAV